MNALSGRVTRPYANPYVAGVGLGLVLLSAFVLMGRGLGATGAFASAAAGIATTVAPESARTSHYFARYLSASGAPRIDWLVVELLGGVSIGHIKDKFLKVGAYRLLSLQEVKDFQKPPKKSVAKTAPYLKPKKLPLKPKR